MRRSIIACLAAACLWASAASAGPKDAQYVVGPGDVLQLNVWQAPSLDRQLTVRSDGILVLPMAGEMRAAGLTMQQLEEQVARRLGDYNRNVNQVSFTVTEFKSRSIYVLGRVVSPGKYAYADAVNLFDLIREAGGFTDDALKTRVKVVHRQGGQEKIDYANVDQALNDGNLDQLPQVRAGDTVIVAKRNGSVEAGSDGVQILGSVRVPAIYALEDVNDLVGVMLLAGGPNDDANLKRVKVVRENASGTTEAIEFNVDAYLTQGVVSQNPVCQPGDTVWVPRKRGALARSLRIVPLVLGSIASSIGIYYAITK
jgi:protein involved in polysaccharide export with SLBB domain